MVFYWSLKDMFTTSSATLKENIHMPFLTNQNSSFSCSFFQSIFWWKLRNENKCQNLHWYLSEPPWRFAKKNIYQKLQFLCYFVILVILICQKLNVNLLEYAYYKLFSLKVAAFNSLRIRLKKRGWEMGIIFSWPKSLPIFACKILLSEAWI